MILRIISGRAEDVVQERKKLEPVTNQMSNTGSCRHSHTVQRAQHYKIAFRPGLNLDKNRTAYESDRVFECASNRTEAFKKAKKATTALSPMVRDYCRAGDSGLSLSSESVAAG